MNITTDELITAARAWLKNCGQWDFLLPEDFEYMSPSTAIAGVQRHYEGGWARFVLDHGAVDA